jgi:sigma-B regulation protein RsbU (phosphoserine phosphatase)
VAREIGGDYFDFIQIEENTLGIAVADIAGKGVSASLIMSAIRTALRLQARQSRNPAEVLEKVDSFISSDIPKGMFVTMFYAVVNLEDRNFVCASAGHNPAFLLRAEENKLIQINPRGLPLGLKLTDRPYAHETFTSQLHTNDLLVLYTDGITECRNASGEQFGANRLTELIQAQAHLTPEQLAYALEQRLNEFSGALEPKDDITLVIFKLGEISETAQPGPRKLVFKSDSASEEVSAPEGKTNAQTGELKASPSTQSPENLPEIPKPIDN